MAEVERWKGSWYAVVVPSRALLVRCGVYPRGAEGFRVEPGEARGVCWATPSGGLVVGDRTLEGGARNAEAVARVGGVERNRRRPVVERRAES